MKSSTQTFAILLLSSAFAAAQTSGPGNGAGAGPLSTTPGTNQAPAPQTNPPAKQPTQGEEKTKKSKRGKTNTKPNPEANPENPGMTSSGNNAPPDHGDSGMPRDTAPQPSSPAQNPPPQTPEQSTPPPTPQQSTPPATPPQGE